jgi:Ca2+-binding EF-hand superfamily protein
MEESKYPDYDSNGINNYENNTILRRRNKRFFSPNNDYENNHIHNTDNCKGCLYSAKNIYNHYKTKKYKNFSNTIDNDNFNAFDNKKRNDYKLKNNKRNDINKYTQLNDYYRIKEELLRKYGNLQKDRNNYFFSSEEDNPSSKNRYFSSPREALLIHNDNNYVNEINNWNDNANKYDNINNEEKEINTSNSKSNINPSSSSLIKNDKNSKKNTFAERYNRIKENKETKGCKNCSSSPKFRDLKKDNIKGNNIKDKKDLLYKLFVDFIDQDLKLEEIKESLSKCQDASLPKIFELFNRNKKNKINSSDLYEVLNSLSRKETFKPNEMKYIFKKYNKSTEIGFNYEDFGNIILPKKASAKISMENRKTNINDELEHDTIGKILELFETLIDGEKSNEEIRSMINMTVDNIFYDLFGEIKKENKPGIQNDDIDKFMKENGYDIKNYEIEIIMEKMDKNRDSIIDYEEFISELQPKIV